MFNALIRRTVAAVAASVACVAHAEACTATNVVVAPLTDAHWTQGAPYNDWTDCPSFEAPGDTNRFFRVKVEW